MKQLSSLLFLLFLSLPAQTSSPEPRDLIQHAIEHWRGVTSYSEMSMTIHRPDWERTMSMRSWTKGDKTSLVRITEPKKDTGSGSLKALARYPERSRHRLRRTWQAAEHRPRHICPTGMVFLSSSPDALSYLFRDS